MTSDGGASDYRSTQHVMPTQNITNRNLPNASNSSIVSTQQTLIFSTKHQAIIFDALDGVEQEEYLPALRSIIHSKNILFSSRILNKASVSTTKEIVEEFINTHKGTLNIGIVSK
ncbi:hypothetical protein JTB14_019367 [Gonioctena quinquepunctata]|nr:hypothetical protein JTB14_019367 [Gonioctena quinquepunctata]